MLKRLENLLQAEVDPAFAKRARFILDTVAKEKPKVLLDIGCGRGFYVHALTLFPFPEQIYGIDIQKDYLDQAKKTPATKGFIYRLGVCINFRLIQTLSILLFVLKCLNI